MDNLRDWRFVVGASILGYLVFANWQAFNSIAMTGGQVAGDYTQILQGRGPNQFIRTR